LILYGVAAAGLVGLAVVLIVILAGGKNGKDGNPSSAAAALRAGGCTLRTSPASLNVGHISGPDKVVTYGTYPPATGMQHPQPAIWGNYTQEVDPRQAVHNEEHGGVVIWIGPDVAAAQRQQISDFYDESPNAILVTPIEDMAQSVKYPKHDAPGSKIYLTAWNAEIKNGNLVKGTGVVATCPRFSEQAFTAFRDEFRGKGPERVPVSGLTPGT
jgi:hypothetical protein